MDESVKIVTLNTNGIRASIRKGLRAWVKDNDIDILCIQETKAQLSKLDRAEYEIEGYTVTYSDAEKAGYSGVAVYSRLDCEYLKDLAWSQEFVVKEGRMLVMSFKGFYLINVYLPSGTTGDVRQDVKWMLLQDFRTYLESWSDKACIILGDFNIAHEQIDIKNWRSNQKKSGFLPYEREWMSDLLSDGWVDTLRHLHPELHQYTWWSQRANARANDVGWRLDYQLISRKYADAIEKTYVDQAKVLSDHAPYVVEYSYEKLLHHKL